MADDMSVVVKLRAKLSVNTEDGSYHADIDIDELQRTGKTSGWFAEADGKYCCWTMEKQTDMEETNG